MSTTEEKKEYYRLTSFIKSHGASVSQSFSSPYAAATGNTNLNVIKDQSPDSSPSMQSATKKRGQEDTCTADNGPGSPVGSRLGVEEITTERDLVSHVKSAQRAISLAIEDYTQRPRCQW